MMNEMELNDFIDKCYDKYLFKIGEILNDHKNEILNYKIINELITLGTKNINKNYWLNLFKSIGYFVIIKTFKEIQHEERYELYTVLLEKVKNEKIEELIILYRLKEK